jgi:Na+/melibiose symporter-like transporter
MSMWSELVLESVVRPRAAARRVLTLDLEPALLVEAAVAVTCLGMVLGWAAFSVSPGAADALTAMILGNPLAGAAVQLGVMLIVVVLVHRVGRALGGKGDLRGALAVVVWLNGIMVLLQAAQLVALLLFTPLAALLAAASFVWAMWAFASFVGELHGFASTVAVLGGVLVTMTLMFFGLALLLAALGLTPQGAG